MPTEYDEPVVLDSTGQRIATALEEIAGRVGDTVTITIVATTTDGVDIVDQQIDIYNAATMVKYGSVVYNSPNTVTVDVPRGFSYLIKPINTMHNHYITQKPTGIALANTTVTLSWRDFGTMETIVDLKAIVDQGMGKYLNMGDYVTCHDYVDNRDIRWDIVNYDENEDAITLLTTETLPDQRVFCPPQALLETTSILTAGNYSFKNGNTTYYFALQNDVPIGYQIRATASAFYVYSAWNSETIVEQGTVSTTALTSPTDLGTCGSGNLNHMDRVNYGDNTYGESPLCQWLRSSDQSNWQVKKTQFDRVCNYNNIPGLLAHFDSDTLDAIENTDVKCVANNVYAAPDSSYLKGQKYTVRQKFFLASEKEIFGTASYEDDSTQFDLYIGATDADRIKRYSGTASYWWLRSPFTIAYSERMVLNTGVDNNHNAYTANGVVLACVIKNSNN